VKKSTFSNPNWSPSIRWDGTYTFYYRNQTGPRLSAPRTLSRTLRHALVWGNIFPHTGYATCVLFPKGQRGCSPSLMWPTYVEHNRDDASSSCVVVVQLAMVWLKEEGAELMRLRALPSCPFLLLLSGQHHLPS
jgi:hypothetical protein